jgi:FixJ family two-component response regulator
MRNAPATQPIEDAEQQVSSQSQPMAHAHVLAALDALPEEFRVVLVLAVIEGFTCKEIAKMLAVPMGTVMSRLGRARARLREQLQGHEAFCSKAGALKQDSPAAKNAIAGWGAARGHDARRTPDGGLIQ